MKSIIANYVKLFPSILVLVVVLLAGCGGYITENAYYPEQYYEDRHHELFVPSGYSDDTPIPIVFAFHGAQSSGIMTQMGSRLNEYAEPNNFIVVYPNAIEGLWSCNDVCSDEYGDDINDMGYFDYLLDKFSAEYNLDLTRVYICGFSLGARFTMNLALERSNVITAAASVAGNIVYGSWDKFNHAGRVPIAIFNGTSDASVPFESAGTGDCERSSIPDMVTKWATHNGCDQSPTIEDLPDTGENYIHVVKETYNNCRDNAETIFYKIEGGSHEWFTFDEFKASAAMTEFFLRHSR